MKRFYVDSSVLVAILLQESAAGRYRETIEQADEVVSSLLLEAEIYSVAARENVPSETAEALVAHISLVMPDRSLLREYRQVFAKGYCRGADAYHLATLLYLDPQRQELFLLTADRGQAKIARSIGIQVIAPHLSSSQDAKL